MISKLQWENLKQPLVADRTEDFNTTISHAENLKGKNTCKFQTRQLEVMAVSLEVFS